ncbi:ICAM1 protein, partial [Bombycilla garrulus]|nr:ICAM1 protein [Bombycilla garrulus]
PFSHISLTLFPHFPHPFPIFPSPFSHISLTLFPYFPVPPRLHCPPQQNWTEGQNGTVLCRARGRPQPRLECSGTADSQNPLVPGVPQRARRGHAGTYVCRATNELGTAWSNVTLWVHCESPQVLGFLWDFYGIFGDFLGFF